MSIEQDVTTIETLQTTHAASLAKIQGDQRLTPQAKQADADKLTAAFEATIGPRIEQTRTAIDEAFAANDQAARDLETAALPRPADPGQWTEAAARAQFIKEDLADAPEHAADLLRSAYRAKDTIGAHLLLRYAPKMIAADNRAASEFRKVAGELYAPDPAKVAKFKAEGQRLYELGQRLPLRATRAQRNDLAQRFGLKSLA